MYSGRKGTCVACSHFSAFLGGVRRGSIVPGRWEGRGCFLHFILRMLLCALDLRMDGLCVLK